MTKPKLLIFSRESAISWLEQNRNNGFFEGHMEQDMNFSKLNDTELRWYWDEWIEPDIQDALDHNDF